MSTKLDSQGTSIVDKFVRLDKIALGVLTALMATMFSQLWVVHSNVTELEIKIAELKGVQSHISDMFKSIIEKGSPSAQRAEESIKGLKDRFQILEEWVTKGPILKREDGDRLERRVERLEAGRTIKVER